MEEIKVSIITVCYNSEKTIERTVQSVCNQSYENIQYIIVDGASKDNTLGIVDKYRPVLGDKLIVVSEKDNGIYDAMNKGLKLATGELIGIINSDDYYENDAVAKIVKAYEADKHELGVYYGGTAIIKENGEFRMAFSDHTKLKQEMITHPSSFVTKAAYDNMGLFNLKYSCVADYDLMYRFYTSGHVTFIPVKEHIANFSLGGMCSTSKAYIDLLQFRMDNGLMPKGKARIEIMKAKLATSMEKHGMKPIQIRKK